MGNYAYPPSGATSVRPHAVISTASGYSYTYDANGNMLTRIELSGTQRYTYTQQWDVDNRLIAMTNTVTLSVTRFYYDGDGQRVKRVESKGGTTITTAYVGAHFEKNVTAGVTTTYYYAGATRVAMRQGSSVYYIHGDHLGSASLTTDASGNKIGELRYMPYGETRYVWGSTPTDRRFTGQREEAALGSLYDYGARFYSPSLNRFISPDTIVPSPGNSADLNRYSYARGNPVKYLDPSGHDPLQWIGQFLAGAVYQWAKTNREAIVPLTPQQSQAADALMTNLATDADALQAGRLAGAIGATAQGVVEIVGGVGVAGGGTLSFATVVGPATGVSEGAVVVGAVAAAHGALVTGRGIVDVAEQSTMLFANTGRGGETVDTIRGRQAHRNYRDALGSDYEYNQPLPSGQRPDAIDWPNRIVRELKPDNLNAIQRGLKQLERYKQELEKITSQKWTSYLDTYRK